MLRTLTASFGGEKKQNKAVSFGEEEDEVKLDVKRVSCVNPEEKTDRWYNKQELAERQARPSFQQCETKKYEASPFSYKLAQKNVKNVVNKCRVQLEQSDGYYDKRHAKELGKIAVQGAKFHASEAQRRAEMLSEDVHKGRARSHSPGVRRTRTTPARSRTGEGFISLRLRGGKKKTPKELRTASAPVTSKEKGRARSLSPFGGFLRAPAPSRDLGSKKKSPQSFGDFLEVLEDDDVTDSTEGLTDRMQSDRSFSVRTATDC